MASRRATKLRGYDDESSEMLPGRTTKRTPERKANRQIRRVLPIYPVKADDLPR